MDKKDKKILLICLLCILAITGCILKLSNPNSDLNNTILEAQNIVENEIKKIDTENEVIVPEYVQSEAVDTIQATLEGDDVSTTEVIESTEEEEQKLEDELEVDATVEQENISYDGTNTGNGLSLLGVYQGLTYYSQADSRWASILYTSTGNSTQTMKSSACGPTSAAMVVSSSKGAILPTTMASLFVSNGYRTANNGTAWSAYSFVADYFDFEEYYYTSSVNTALDYLKKGYYVIASCGSGLFTTGGHYIVLVADDGNTITVYDPYLYSGKFTTASRRAAGATVSGNSVYVSESSFKNFANAKGFWVYSNDKGAGKTPTEMSATVVNYTKYVATQSSNLNVRSNPGGTVIGSLKKGTAVNVIEIQGDWSHISSPVNGWVNSSYLSSLSVTNTPVITGYKTGTYKTTSNLNVRTGAGTQYRAKKSSQLTANARQQNARLGGTFNGYRKGVVCTVTKVSANWGYTSSGWICLDYAKKQ